MTRQADPAASRAVLIGVSEYAEPERWEALPATRTNVEDLRTVLTDPAAWGLPTENCAALVDPRDRLAVLEAVAEAANEARDTVFVYYTGHGATTEEDLLLTLASTTSKNLGYSAVEFAAVRRIVQGRRAAHAVIVLDCCFSGKAHAMADPVSFLDTQINAASAYTLTSSARNSISLAPPGERHTAFTGALLGVLAAGSPYAGELLTLADMTRAVSGALADRQMPTPRYSQSGPADVLALVRNRAWRPTAVPDAAPVADPRTDPAVTRDAMPADLVPPPAPATPPGSSRVVAGIDLGHTNATISLMLDGEAVVVENEDGRTGTPPYVAIGAAGTEVGERARRRLDRHPGQVAHLRMPAIGTPWTREVGGRRYAMHDVAGMVLAQLKRDAENACGRTVSEAAIAVPSDFTAEQCDLLRVAADGVGLTRVTFENSAVAAATAAGLLDGGNGRLLVFDLGGTSLDVAVLDGEGEPLASHVDRGLGAETWGGRVADMLIRRFQAESGLDLRTDDQALQRVTEAAQTAVEQLSALEETAVSLPFIGAGAQGPLHLAIQVSRGDLAREAEGLIDRCHSAIRQATRLLPEIPEKSGRFERVLLIGGGTLIPTIAEVIDATYAERETVAGGDSPGLVARGAAMMAAGVPA